MHNYLTLTKVLLKNSSGGMVDGKSNSRKLTMIGLTILLIIGLSPLPFVFYEIYDNLIQQVSLIGQAGTVLAIAFSISTSITFFFSLFLIPSIFYYAKDIQTLLYLPLKPETILGSKFTICILYEYLFEAFAVLPALFAYANNGMMDLTFLLFFIIIFLALPILPLAYSAFISMLIMRFIPFFKDRDKFNLLSGLIGILFGIGINIALQSVQFEDSQQFLTMLVTGENSFIKMFSYFFPTISPAAFACVDGDILQFLIFIGITAFIMIILLILGKAFYFKGAIGVSESKSTHRATDSKLLNKQSARKNIIHSYMIEEIRVLFRTPVYFLNCISIVIIFPLIMFFTIFSNDAGNILSSLKLITWDQDWLYSFALIGTAVGLLYSNINSISSTALSRTGNNYTFMKYIPVSYETQIYAKIYTGILFSELGILLLIIPAIFILKIPFLFGIILFVTSLLSTIAGNFVGIIIDIIRPKLVWEQEAAAVKQNMNSFVAMMMCMAISFVMIFILFKLDQTYWSTYSIIVSIVILISIPLLYRFVGKLANRKLKDM